MIQERMRSVYQYHLCINNRHDIGHHGEDLDGNEYTVRRRTFGLIDHIETYKRRHI